MHKAARDPSAAAIRAAFSAVNGAIVGPAARDVCSPELSVQVPLRNGKAGKLTLKSVAEPYGRSRDKDGLKLLCRPS